GDFAFRKEPASLHAPHSGVMAVAREQLRVSSVLDNFPAIEDDNAVEVGNRRQTMCNDDGCASSKQVSDAVLNMPFGNRVQAGCRFIQEEYRRILENRP